MAEAKSVSLARFTTAVQAAVKAAVQKHPKFRMDIPDRVAVSYLIRGIPVPEALAAQVSLAETRAFAADIAAQLGSGAEAAALDIGRTVEGAVFSHGNHLILGIPAPPEFLLEK